MEAVRFSGTILNEYLKVDSELQQLCKNCKLAVIQRDSGKIEYYSRLLKRSLLRVSNKVLGQQVCKTLISVARYYFSVACYEDCIDFISTILQIRHYLADPFSLIKILILESNAENLIGHPQLAIENLKDAIRILEKIYKRESKEYSKAIKESWKTVIFDKCYAEMLIEEKNYEMAYKAYAQMCKSLLSIRQKVGKGLLKLSVGNTVRLAKPSRKNTPSKAEPLKFMNRISSSTIAKPASHSATKKSTTGQSKARPRNNSYFLFVSTIPIERNSAVKANNMTLPISSPPRTPESLLRIELKQGTNNKVQRKRGHSFDLPKYILPKSSQDSEAALETGKNENTIRVVEHSFAKENTVSKVKENRQKKEEINQKYMENIPQKIIPNYEVVNQSEKSEHSELGVRLNLEVNEDLKSNLTKFDIGDFSEVDSNKGEAKKIQLIKLYSRNKVLLEMSVTKIQAYYRGRLSREYTNLIRNKKNVVKAAARIINGVAFHIRVSAVNLAYLIRVSNFESFTMIELPHTISIINIIINLHMRNFNEVYYYEELQSPELNYSYVASLDAYIDDQCFSIKYTENLKKHEIKAETTLNGLILNLVLQKSLQMSSIYYITHFINNYLSIESGALILAYPKSFTTKDLLYMAEYKPDKSILKIYIYKVTSSSGVDIEVLVQHQTDKWKLIQFFNPEIFEKHLKTSVFSEKSHIYFLAFNWGLKNIALKSSLNTSFVASDKLQFGKLDYLVRAFEFIEKKKVYLIEVINNEMPKVGALAISRAKLKKKFKLTKKQIPEKIHMIFSRLRIKDSQLYFLDTNTKLIRSLEKTERLLKSTIALQRSYRSYAQQNKIKLKLSKQLIIDSLPRRVQGIDYKVSVYSILDKHLIEVLHVLSKELFFIVVMNPRDYISYLSKPSDIYKLVEAISIKNNKLCLSKSNQCLTDLDPECTYFKKSPFNYVEKFQDPGWPYFTSKLVDDIPNIVQGYLDLQKNVIATFIPCDLTSPIYCRSFTPSEVVKTFGIYHPVNFINSLKVSFGIIFTSGLLMPCEEVSSNELMGVVILCKVCIKYKENMYLICCNFEENKDDYLQSELRFYARINSSLEKCRKISLKLDEAATLSGFDSKSLAHIGNYIAKNMIKVSDEEFFIDKMLPPVNLTEIMARVQGYARGYLSRKKFHINMTFLYKDYFKIFDSSYCVLIYALNSLYYCMAIKGSFIYKHSLDHEFIKQLRHSSNQKALVSNKIIANFSFNTPPLRLQGLKRQSTFSVPKTLESQRTIGGVPSLLTSLRTLPTSNDSSMTLVGKYTITPNHITYTAKIYSIPGKIHIEICSEEDVIAKKTIKEVEKIESYLKKAHVDVAKGRIMFETRTVFNEVVFIDKKQVSLIIYEHKNGIYADGFIIDSKRPTHLFLGESIRIASILSRLEVKTEGQKEKLKLKDY